MQGRKCIYLKAPATYKSAYLIISHHNDAPEKALEVYGKCWRIEVFFRAAKHELDFEKYHSTSEVHQHAHMELLFTGATSLAYALWQVQRKDLSRIRGEMVHGFFRIRCQVRIRNHKRL